MMGKIIIKQENVDDSTLDDFIQALEKATGCTIKWSTVYELEVDDPKAAAILQTVFSDNGEVKKKKAMKEAKTKGSKAGRVVKNKWTVLSGIHAGEVLVTQKVNKAIACGALDPGTKLSHPKLGARFVSNGKLIEEPSIHPTEVVLDEVPA
jgi:hypothetical protein